MKVDFGETQTFFSETEKPKELYIENKRKPKWSYDEWPFFQTLTA